MLEDALSVAREMILRDSEIVSEKLYDNHAWILSRPLPLTDGLKKMLQQFPNSRALCLVETLDSLKAGRELRFSQLAQWKRGSEDRSTALVVPATAVYSIQDPPGIAVMWTYPRGVSYHGKM